MRGEANVVTSAVRSGQSRVSANSVDVVEAVESAKLPNVRHPSVPGLCRVVFITKVWGKRLQRSDEERMMRVGWRDVVAVAVRHEAVSRSYAGAGNIDPRSDSRSAATEVYACSMCVMIIAH